jgi:tight adherence protein B
MILAETVQTPIERYGPDVVVFLASFWAIVLGYAPLKQWILRREYVYGRVLRENLLLDISPRGTTMAGIAVILLLAIAGYFIADGLSGAILGIVAGILLPGLAIRYLRRQRLKRLNAQLVDGIQTLASGVRAGLNLVQSMQLVARDGPIPLRQEFAHMLREYEYGTPLEAAMDNAAERIGSGDYRLLFAALQTHRERGGDLGDTLDRIADSIREIQRLEGRVESLTAQGRANARFLGMLVVVVLGILYMIDSSGVKLLFTDDLGRVILAAVVVLNIAGFLWIRKIVSVDI